MDYTLIIKKGYPPIYKELNLKMYGIWLLIIRITTSPALDSWYWRPFVLWRAPAIECSSPNSRSARGTRRASCASNFHLSANRLARRAIHLKILRRRSSIIPHDDYYLLNDLRLIGSVTTVLVVQADLGYPHCGAIGYHPLSSLPHASSPPQWPVAEPEPGQTSLAIK